MKRKYVKKKDKNEAINNQINALLGQIHDLEFELSDAQDLNDIYIRTIERMKNKIMSFENGLFDKTMEIEGLNEKINKLLIEKVKNIVEVPPKKVKLKEVKNIKE